jgi:hypothetical protein
VTAPIVLSLCDRTGNMVRPWLDAGHECWIVDVQHATGWRRAGNLVTVGADVLTWLPPRRDYLFVAAFPPCTDLAVSGARWYKDKGLGALAHAAELVERCRLICEWSDAPWMLENPVGTLSTYWRKPDHKFDPHEFAQLADDPDSEAYTKRTCLWTGGGFVMPERSPLAPMLGSAMWLLPPSEDRADLRSVTPTGFARAVYLANAPVLEVSGG